jgi:hypothetical protein
MKLLTAPSCVRCLPWCALSFAIDTSLSQGGGFVPGVLTDGMAFTIPSLGWIMLVEGAIDPPAGTTDGLTQLGHGAIWKKEGVTPSVFDWANA